MPRVPHPCFSSFLRTLACLRRVTFKTREKFTPKRNEEELPTRDACGDSVTQRHETLVADHKRPT
ncbi:hypothetical protein E2C01_040304 [Portunus trituberculatus]|uniref:Uncharacterized protein n=1 Tax=Portunus trituberculatus TaxID=210409 RepID=A0A5B7FNE7_PORTR|nr:hypothetical protein [Portunus trituberculatus]